MISHPIARKVRAAKEESTRWIFSSRRIWPLLPAGVFLLLLFLAPVGQILWRSFTNADGLLTTVHYERLLSSSVYVRVLWNTVKVSTCTTLLCLLFGYPVAYLLAHVPRRTRQVLMLLVLVPFWTSFLVRTFAWIVLLGRSGVVNGLFNWLGYGEPPVQLIYNTTGVLIGMVHALMPLAIITMLPVMEGIDANLSRAAATLGAPRGQAFWRIYFPLSIPGVAAAALLVFITALGFFITPALLGSGRDAMIAQLIIEQVDQLLNWAFAGAIAVLLLIFCLIVFVVFDRVFGLGALAGQAAARRDRAESRSARLVGRLGRHFIDAICVVTDILEFAWGRIRPKRPDRPGGSISMPVLRLFTAVVFAFLLLPVFFIAPISFSASTFINWPPRGFTLHWYEQVVFSPQWVTAAVRSFGVGLAAASLTMILTVPAAFVLVRENIRLRTAITAMLLSPLIIPRILIAVSLFYFVSVSVATGRM